MNLQLIHGDCMERMKDIPNGSVDMVLCDMPYGTTRNHWDALIPLEALWDEYCRICKANAAIVLFSQMPFAANLISSKPDWFRYEWIWEKSMGTGFLNANKMPLKIHENVLVFYRSLPTYNPQFGDGKPYTATNGAQSSNYNKRNKATTINDGKRYPTDVIRFSRENADQYLHPTQKPVNLCEYLIRTYSNAGELVLDNCMGSGTTGVACARTGRNFIGIEKELKYYEAAKKRIEQENAQMRLDDI